MTRFLNFVYLFSLSILFLDVTAVFINPNNKLTTWKGWGTGLPWFGHFLGDFDSDVQREIYNALFSPDKLNLNIIRYTIGGTTPGDQSCGPFHPGAATESFQDGPDRLFIWTRDSRTRRVLLEAQKLGVDAFEAVSRTPPSWLTRSGCTKGNPDGAPLHDNFDPTNSHAYAEYLTEVIKNYRILYNITFSSLSLFNEPSSGKWNGPGSNEEGCNMERSTMVQLTKSVNASLKAKGLTFCNVSAAGESNITEELLTQSVFTESGISSLYSRVNLKHHDWDQDKDKITKVYSMADKNRFDIWITDIGVPESSLEDMTQGIRLAERIIFDLKNILPTAWVYFQAAEDQLPGYHGLLDIPVTNASTENVRLNSGYFAMMHFSKHIKKGFTIVQIDDKNSVAAHNDDTRVLVIVTLNAGLSSISKTFDLSYFGFDKDAFLEVYRTSSKEAHVVVPSPTLLNKTFSFEFPPKSITTFKLGSAYVSSDSRNNLIREPDFESVNTDGWQLLYGSREDNGINGRFVRRGERSGYLDFSESKLALAHTTWVYANKTFYLSAWCCTNGPNTTLGVLVNDQEGPKITLAVSKGYVLYGLFFEAEWANNVTVYLEAEQGNYTAQIDDVAIH